MRPDASGEGELFEELLQPLNVLALARIHLAVSAFQEKVRDEAWSAMPWTGYHESVEIVLLDHAIEVNISKRLLAIGSPWFGHASLSLT